MKAINIPPLQELKLKDMRKAKGLTLKEVEKITGMSHPYLSQLENGLIKEPSYNKISTLVTLYNKTTLK